ncbi:hypothetical protein [Luteibacter sp. ME-Dv--P-043b]|uniref:hypothetical protein n=1 Tax=Luteibacter sp. ME-Dv--P-043b TaxID=3040291 RepID=UPI00255354C8|nr:hypothetical protein [Luteibacter sp. ME-Dv--P-043b]
MPFIPVLVVAWVLVTGLLLVLGAPFTVSAILAFVPALMTGGLTRLRWRPQPLVARPFLAKGEPPLNATYASDNLALDATSGRLWLRDVTGRRLIVDLADVAAWEHTWTDTSNAWGHRSRIRNELAFRLRRLDIPTVRVLFRRYSDAFNGNKNFEEAATWQARITTLING